MSERGRSVKRRIETLTDELAAKPYESLEPDELDELMAMLQPLATLLLAAQDYTMALSIAVGATHLQRSLATGVRPTSGLHIRVGFRRVIERFSPWSWGWLGG